MRFLSVCSGIEAASAAWNPLGWKAVAFSEIEPFPCAVLAHHFPDTPNWGDMTKFQEWPDVAIDLLCGGTPCQSFSVAGLRKGLADPRGNLMLTFGAIAAKYRPQWLVWENVPGVLSAGKGRDFASFLGLITGQEVAVPAGGWQNSGIVSGIDSAYGVAYRVLDAQYFGVPQRRRRVFVVAYLGDWRRSAAVLFERHSLSGHPAPSRQARQGAAVCARAGTSPGGGWRVGADEAAAVQLIPEIVGQAMNAKWSKGTAGPAGPAGDEHHNLLAVPAVAGTLQNAGKAAGSATQQDAESGLLIAHSLRGEGFDASEDGTGRGTPLVPVAYAIQAGATRTNLTSGPGGIGVQADHAFTLEARAEVQAIAFDTTQVTSAANRSNPKPGDPCHPLAAGAHAPAIAFDGRMRGAEPAVGREERPPQTMVERTGAIDSTKPGNVAAAMQVRRLTPEECEALQGFPRGHTDIPFRGKPAADGPRYKALGNSWAVPCARWIGERINQVQSHHVRDAA